MRLPAFQSYLDTPAVKWYSKLENIGIAFFIIWVYTRWGIPRFIDYLDDLVKVPVTDSDFTTKPFIYSFFYSCISSPLMEEAFFRYVPLTLTKNWSFDKRIAIMIFSSIVFGFMHDDRGSYWIQGVSGLIFCLLYVKNGYSYWSSVALHFLWNVHYYLFY